MEADRQANINVRDPTLVAKTQIWGPKNQPREHHGTKHGGTEWMNQSRKQVKNQNIQIQSPRNEMKIHIRESYEIPNRKFHE